MPYELGGTGILGVAFETTYGTYIAPTKWIPIRSESLTEVEDKIYRTNIRGLADRSGAIQGYTHIEGDIEFDISGRRIVYCNLVLRHQNTSLELPVHMRRVAAYMTSR